MTTTVYIGTSLDGFIARKDGSIDWLVQFANDEAIHAYEKFISRIDAIVIGRGTFEKVLTFPSWPYEKKVFVLSTSIKTGTGSSKRESNGPFNEASGVTGLSFRKRLFEYLC
jgi:dihydrofolate reductase